MMRTDILRQASPFGLTQHNSNCGVLAAAASGLSDFILSKGADVDRVLGTYGPSL